MRAVVGQRTGEDWSGVALTLSTADAERWSELPELPSLKIGRRQPPKVKRGWREPPVGVEALYRDFDFAFGGDGAPSAMSPEYEQEDFDDVYTDAEDFYDDDTHDLADAFGESAARTLVRDAPFEGRKELDSTREVTLEVPRSAPKKKRARTPDAQFFEPPPPPQRSSAPPPPSAMMPGAPPPEAVSSSFAADSLAMLGSASGAGAPVFLEESEAEPEPLSLLAADDMLAYGALRMPPASSTHRGRLIVADRVETYMQLLVEQKISVSFDVLAVIEGAYEIAQSVSYKQPPQGCPFAWSDDYDYAFVSDNPVEIPSDGEFHSIPIANKPTNAKLRYVVVPRESTDSFRFAEIENPFDSPLLAGPADIYLGDDFLLTSDLRFTAPKGTIKIGLGVEQAIKVSRNSRFSEDTAGFMGGSRALKHEVDIELRNLLERKVEVEVRERVPVLREGEDDIKLEITKTVPAWKSYKPFPDQAGQSELRGGHRWLVDLEKGAKKKLELAYEIRISSKHELVGGNRRES
jgi:hypothetical protein